ncbi:MAG TPA: CoA pyrophosphatase [Bacillus bacterium]|nr:CoA pyrophosphatase [Bacillus sp. (in: firmicutes)]
MDGYAISFQKIKNNLPHILGNKSFKTYAVLVPLIKTNDDIEVIFEVRAHSLRRQPGEISFPGGRIDQDDENSKAAAIRETCEELQINKKEIDVIGPLDFYVTSTEAIIYPYVGWIEKNLADISPNSAEVNELFTVPLSFLLKAEPEIYRVNYEVQPEDDFPFHLIPNGKNYNWRQRGMREYFYYYEDKVIWGMTARILHEFLEKLK